MLRLSNNTGHLGRVCWSAVLEWLRVWQFGCFVCVVIDACFLAIE
jgi:hypothetical protein